MSGSRKNSPRPLGEVLREVTRSLGIDGKLQQGRIIATWEEVLGERMAGHVERSWMKGDRLYIRVKSPAWRQEIHLRRQEWRRRLNEELGEDLVSEIVVR